MKRIFPLLFLFISATSVAQVYYYQPKTLVAITVEYEEITRQQGPFYQYAEKYLGTKDVIKADSTYFAFKSAQIGTRTLADTSKKYTFTPVKGIPVGLTIDKKGILAAYNATLPTPVSHTPARKPGEGDACTHAKGGACAHGAHANTSITEVMPLLEETMRAASLSKMAEGAAKQIYRIREARMALLSGEIESLPADGKAMALTLREMDEQEAALVALFVGKTNRRTLQQVVVYEPETTPEVDAILFRFSRFSGVVAADDLSGEPYYLSVTPAILTKQKSKKEPAAIITYNTPGSAFVRLTNGLTTIAEKTVPVAQFGFTAPLSLDLLSRKPHILFDTKTGAIQSITE